MLKFRILAGICLLVCAVAVLAQTGKASPSRAAAIIDSMPKATEIGQVAISPDGLSLACVMNGNLTISSDAGGSHTVELKEKLALRSISWSADGTQIVFLADIMGGPPTSEVWTVGADGKRLTKFAKLKGYVDAPRFSPDSSRIAMLFIENMPRVAGPLEPMTPLAGDVSESVFEQRLITIDSKTKEITKLTPPDEYVYEYDWTPDGKNLVASAAHGSGDANWWIARLFRVDATSGAMTEIYHPKLQVASPRVSPDGKSVAFIEGLMSDAGLTGGDIMLVPVAGGEAHNLTPGIKSSPSYLAWTAPETITFVENLDGNSSFATVSSKGGDIRVLWTGEEFVRDAGDAFVPSASFATKTPVVAVIRSSSSTPPEVWMGPIGEWKQITHVNGSVKATWGESRNVHWTNGTTRVQGWLTLPKDYSPDKAYPLVVDIHGGPSWAHISQWDVTLLGPLSSMGYFVLRPNPRGSYGQGEQFTQGNVKDFGGGDFADIMAGIDAISRDYPIDQKRVGIRGHSYGGYMTMWAETQTNRFAAAVAGAGLSDWLSYYGVNDIDEWMIPFFGASIYDDPAVYAKSDPMHFVKAVKTPTLILVGDRDGEVPMEQSVEWWHALDTLGVPVKLVVYPNEGHLFRTIEDARDYDLRTLEWFDQWFNKAH
jgi:dipeptidyl aminopeptidase/acylaminoacyl peptidase